MVKVRVADTGIGVSLDKQDKLFQSFSQVDGSVRASTAAPAWDLRSPRSFQEAKCGEFL